MPPHWLRYEVDEWQLWHGVGSHWHTKALTVNNKIVGTSSSSQLSGYRLRK